MASQLRAQSRASPSTTRGKEREHTTHDYALLSATHAVRQLSPASRPLTVGESIKDDAHSAAVSTGRIANGPANVSNPFTTTSPRIMNGSQDDARRANTLSAPSLRSAVRAASPSHAAALAATARAGTTRADNSSAKALPRKNTQPLGMPSTSSRPPVVVKPPRLSSQHSQSIDSPTDTTSIAPTTSLVSLFEQKSGTAAPLATQRPRTSNSLPSQSQPPLTPRKPSDGFWPVLQNEMGSAQRSQDISHIARETQSGQEKAVLEKIQTGGSRQDGNHRPSPDNNKADDGLSQLKGSFSPVHPASDKRGDHGPGTNAGDPNREVGTASDSEIRGRQGAQVLSLRTAAQETLALPTSRPSERNAPALPPRASASNLQRSETSQPPLQETPKPLSRTSTAPIKIQPRDNPHSGSMLSSSAQSAQSLNATYRQLYPSRHATTLTSDHELANAIVASSLASSRLNSPSRKESPPLPPSRRHSRHGRSLFHSRTPSPTKGGLRQTLRKQDSSSSSDEDEDHPYNKHHKRRLIRKHPNKHHEGDRKRWRDAVTELERKRYEGVWAANKGLHIQPLPYDPTRRSNPDVVHDQVSNLVTRDIWSRSRLPDHELEAIWDLVDSESTGRLSREEFVVGMWLIDQRLKGRKLPVKVTPTVWTSVRGLQGIKVRK